jgi:glycosyltransferase involved in cell wall biosynthesis
MALTLLSVNNYYYARGGAEVAFLRHNGMLSAAGWSIAPFCMKHESNRLDEWNDDFVDEIELGRASDGLLAKVRKGAKAVYSFEARKKVERLIDRVDPDLCHAHNIYHHISPSILSVIHRREIPLVMTLHDLKIACPAYSMLTHDGVCERCRDGRLFQVATNRCMKGSAALSVLVMIESYLHRYLRSYLDNVDAFIVPSRFFKKKLGEWGFDESRFEYVPNFVDVEHVEPRFEPGRRFVYFGRLTRQKGVATLIEAAAAAGVSLDVIGEGPEKEQLEKLAAARGGDVRFLGYLTGDALRDAIAGARAVVMPSEGYENAPLSVLEACGLGKPVIVADIGGIPEMVADGETGWIFPPRSVESLAERLRFVADLADDDVRAAGEAARRRVAEEFSPQRYMEGVRRVYGRLGVVWH